MALVLAFGVQGTADAVQYPNEDEGTLISEQHFTQLMVHIYADPEFYSR